MKILLSQSREEAIAAVVMTVLDKVISHPSIVIGLATGKTMEPVYALWVKEASRRKIDHSRCFFFMLDEYLGLPFNHPSSFKKFIEDKFQKPLRLRDDQFSFPPVQALTPESGAAHYEQSLKECGGIDLQLLGIGTNGHIGFNEPGSDKDSRTRRVSLSEETITNNSLHFQGEMPIDALSMGIGTIMESKSIIMLALGKSKADAIKYLQNHHDDKSCPATFLKSHPHFTLVLDPEASSKINLNI